MISYIDRAVVEIINLSLSIFMERRGKPSDKAKTRSSIIT